MYLYTLKFQSTLPRRERLCRRSVCWQFTEFQSTLPRRERHRTQVVFGDVAKISIHAPAKGATSAFSCYNKAKSYFNPRSREGSDSPKAVHVSVPPQFQSTLPRRERRHAAPPNLLPKQFQSTLPRRERLSQANTKRIIHNISIHAPAKGATAPVAAEKLRYNISIHAPAKGATYSLNSDTPR